MSTPADDLQAALAALIRSIGDERYQRKAPVEEAPAPSPVPAPTPAPAPAPAPKGGFPTAATTGVPNGVVLTPSGGIVVTKPGTVIEGKDIKGQVYIQADNVTVRRCKVATEGYYVVRVEQGRKGAVVEDCDIDGLKGCLIGIGGAGTFRRNDIRGCENGVNVETNVPTKIEGNYIHGFGNTGSPHYDGIQIFGDNENVEVIGNTVINDGTPGGVSCVFIANTFGAVNNVRVAGNYFAGGGYPVYHIGTYTDAPITNVIWEDNYVAKGGYGYNLIRPDSKGNMPVVRRHVETDKPLPPEQAPRIA